MAEAVLLPIAQAIIRTFTSLGVQEIQSEIKSFWGVKDEIEKLENTVSVIQAVLQDAEEKFYSENHQLKDYVGKLKEALYDADDLLDDFYTEALRRKVMSGNKVRLFFSRSNQLVYGVQMAHKTKAIRDRLDEIIKDIKLATVSLQSHDHVARGREETDSFPLQLPERSSRSNFKLWGVFHVIKKVVSKYALIVANFILEILLLIFDQLASPHKPIYALLALMVSLIAMVICAGAVIYKGQSKNGQGFMYWLCHPFSNDCPYTFIDAFCTAAAVSQVVFSSIAYSYFHQGRENPVKVSISAIIFTVCYGYSTIKEMRKVNRVSRTSAMEISDNADVEI